MKRRARMLAPACLARVLSGHVRRETRDSELTSVAQSLPEKRTGIELQRRLHSTHFERSFRFFWDLGAKRGERSSLKVWASRSRCVGERLGSGTWRACSLDHHFDGHDDADDEHDDGDCDGYCDDNDDGGGDDDDDTD